MDNKNIIIVLLCIIIVIMSLIIVTGMFSPKMAENNANITNTTENSKDTGENTTVEHISNDEVSNDYSSNNQKTHTEHLNGGDVEVDSNGMVVGSYNPDGKYIKGGQMSGMSIEEARSMDEYISVHGME